MSRPREKRFDTSMVMKADALRTKSDDEVENISPLASVLSPLEVLLTTGRVFRESIELPNRSD